MCGLIGGALPQARVEAALDSIAHRGPDARGVYSDGTFTLGHTRLAIQDLTEASAQPYFCDGLAMTYNGELWDRDRRIAGDTPRVAYLLADHGAAALPLLHGMFALAWIGQTGTLYLARDEFGEVPLHFGWTPERRFVYASEIGPLLELGAARSTVAWLRPGHVLSVTPGGITRMEPWTRFLETKVDIQVTPEQAAAELADLLSIGATSRMTADVPVAVLASGGLDSTAVVVSLVQAGFSPPLYTAVHDPRSADLRHARIVAKELSLPLVEVPVKVSADVLARAVRVSEQPHKAQVEIAAACLPLAEAIASDGFKVVLSGEGSDELWGSYGLSYHGIRKQGFGPYRRDLFVGQHRKNFARVNKVFMAAGVEARMPFLEPDLVRFGLRLSQPVVTDGGRHLKAVLAHGVEATGLIPQSTVWRTKRAFQTEARIDSSAAAAVASPRAYYWAEYERTFRGVTP